MIIGLTGPICAGKDEVAKILVSLGFERFSLSDEIRAELKRTGVELRRDNIQECGDYMRRKEGVGVWARRIVPHLKNGKNYVIDSIRNPGEVEELRQLGGFFLIKISAAKKLRFARMIKRGRERDPVTSEEFERLELKDLGIGQPDYGQQHAQCFALADNTIINEGTIERLREETIKLVGELHSLISLKNAFPGR
jgi:dephospho-CoA kinase